MNFAANLNNQGANLLGNGHLEDATSMFREAIKAMQQLLHCEQLSTATMKQSPSPETITKTLSPSTSAVFVWSTAMELPTLLTDGEADDDHQMDSHCCAIFYNLALVQHLHGLSNPSRMTHYAEKALRLYAMAFESNEKTLFDNNCTFKSLILLNNMAQLFHELGKYEQSRCVLNEMTSRASEVLASSELLGTCLAATVNALLLNAMLLNEPDTSAAA